MSQPDFPPDAHPSKDRPGAGDVASNRGKDTGLLTPRVDGPLSVKLIGLGGVGGIVARYGALFLGSLDRDSRLVLIDGDDFEPNNANRMYFASHRNKATVIREKLLEQLAHSRVALSAIEEYVAPDNIDRLIHEGDIVILAVDNHATRKLASDFCSERRDDICLISGGNDGVGEDSSGRLLRGTYGNCQIYVRRGGQDITASLTRFHPEIDKPADRLPTDLSCTELVGSVPQILFANLATASSILNTLWLHLCGAAQYDELCFDIADGMMRPAGLKLPSQERKVLAR